ncbi:MAG: hypothetical protein HC930_05025 [Hydrococcus sp. SU_1_0]|nr:hypothetical protein [Hydrococcus sp. SU_1_0]
MTTNSIFANDIFSGDLINPLVPELGQEYISLGIEKQEISLTPSINEGLSLIKIEPTNYETENSLNNGLLDNNSSAKRISSLKIDPIIGTASRAVQINSGVDINDTSFAPPQSELEFVGGFGDFEGGNDVTLKVKNHQNKVIETFSLTGEGQASLYRDDQHEYIFFSNIDKTTKVNISAISNLKFGDFIGDSLKIETTGSIEGGDIVLNNEDHSNSGLSLKSGLIDGKIINYQFQDYSLVNFGDVQMVDLNYYGHVVGNLVDYDGREKIFYYNGANLFTLGRYYSSEAFAINDYDQIAGEGIASNGAHTPFIVNSDGSTYELEYMVGDRSFTTGNGSGSGTTIYYTPEGFIRDINNYYEVAVYLQNLPPSPEYPSYEDAFFVSSEGGVNIGLSLLHSDNSRAFGINDLGQVVGINKETNRAFVYSSGSNSITQLGTLAGDDYSAAYEINNQGQVIGVSSSSSDSRAFIYSNGVMQDIGVSYVADSESRVGIDINNLGQVVVTSADNKPFFLSRRCSH